MFFERSFYNSYFVAIKCRVTSKRFNVHVEARGCHGAYSERSHLLSEKKTVRKIAEIILAESGEKLTIGKGDSRAAYRAATKAIGVTGHALHIVVCGST